MKCKNCGAEVGNAKFCEFCGSQITSEMRREQEQINKVGCPKCGSSNVSFNREKQGEIKGKKGISVVRSTVGVCKDCGYTWVTSDNEPKKNRKTWLWVLGWIFIFPLPLTILLLRKKDMKPVLKYGLIAVVWIVYLIIGMSGKSSNNDTNNAQQEPAKNNIYYSDNGSSNATTAQDKITQTDGISQTDENKAVLITLTGGELGEYGFIVILNENSDWPDTRYEYAIPAGTYEVTNTNTQYTQQLDILMNEITKNEDNIEEQEAVSATLFKAGETREITLEEGQVVEIEKGEVWTFLAK